MSDDAPSTTPESDIQFVSVDEMVPISELLQTTLAVVHNSENNRIPLTLSIPSGLIFGLAVHPAVWLDAMADQIRTLQREAVPPEQGGEDFLPELYTQLAKNRRDTVDDTNLDQRHQIGYAYLVNGAIVSPTSAPNSSSFLRKPSCFQVPLDQVSAWTIGVPGHG